jgi:hypothetical protein
MDFNEISTLMAMTLGISWASGINLYAAVLALGLAGATGHAVLPEELQILQSPIVIAAAALMYCVEFAADKIPGVDTGWDAIHTFIRIPAGALLAAGMLSDVGMAAELAAALVGGSIAAGTHATKAGSRALINTSPEPFSNWAASVGEDIAVFAGVWAMINHPWVFIGLLILFILFMIWVLPKIWRGIRMLLRKIRGKKDPPEEELVAADQAEPSAVVATDPTSASG